MPENNITDKERALGGVTVEEQDAKRLKAARGLLDELLRERHGLSSTQDGAIEVDQQDVISPRSIVEPPKSEIKTFPMDEHGYVIGSNLVPIDFSRRLVKSKRSYKARKLQEAA